MSDTQEEYDASTLSETARNTARAQGDHSFSKPAQQNFALVQLGYIHAACWLDVK